MVPQTQYLKKCGLESYPQHQSDNTAGRVIALHAADPASNTGTPYI